MGFPDFGFGVPSLIPLVGFLESLLATTAFPLPSINGLTGRNEGGLTMPRPCSGTVAQALKVRSKKDRGSDRDKWGFMIRLNNLDARFWPLFWSL